MKYDEELNNIIFKYKLDDGYPLFQKKISAEKYIHRLICQWKAALNEDQKMLCIAATEDQILHIRFYTYGDDRFDYITYEKLKKGNGRKEGLEIYRSICIISNQERKEIASWLEAQGLEYESLYECFEREDLKFDGEYYIFLHEPILDDSLSGYKTNNSYFFEMGSLRERLENVPDNKEYLKKAIFISLVYRDFLLFGKYVTKLISISVQGERVKYESLQREVTDLLNDIKGAIARKKKQDIVMLWMDQLRYQDIEKMPNVSRIMREGVFFENAFTVVPWTVPTYRCTFTDTKEMSSAMHNHEKRITQAESPICQYMDEKGYVFKVVSEYFVRRGYIDRHWEWGGYIEPHAPASLILWNTICCMGENEKPVFVIAHELSHSHDPWQTTEFSQGFFQNHKKRYFCAHKELDWQIEYYSDFMKKSTRIFMSDHGWGEPWDHTHTALAIVAENLDSMRIREMFSYRYLGDLIKQILEGFLDVSKLVTEYAQIFCFPIYNQTLVETKIRDRRLPMELIGYRGVVTQDHLYLLYSNKKEVLLDRSRLPRKLYIIPHESDICNSALLPWFRQHLGKLQLDLNDEKMIWARKSLLLAEKIGQVKRNQLDYINRWISNSGLQRIAIRMGGEHSYTLFEWLTEDNRQKITAFIDNDLQCICNVFGKPVIRPEEVQTRDIDGVILSSYTHLELLRNETSLYPLGTVILDIYDYIQKEGFPDKDIRNDLVGLPDSEYEACSKIERVK